VRVDGATDNTLSGADPIIIQALLDSKIPYTTDWELNYPCSAEISDDILGTIRARTAEAVAATNARMNRPVKRCKKCGHTSGDGAMFTTGGGNVCDDCF
jgi:hypothetical protein